MTIKRVDTNSIRCFISQEEMQSQGIGLEDLLISGSKAETLLRYILQEAKEKLDFNVQGGALSVQLTVMPGGDVSMMIIDNEKSAVRTMLEQFRDSILAFRDILEEAKKSMPQNRQNPLLVDKDGKNINEVIHLIVWAEFKSMEDVIRFAHDISYMSDTKSTLYKHNDIYYLRMDIDQTRGEVARTAFETSEYASFIYVERPDAADIAEHGTVIRENDAISVLSVM